MKRTSRKLILATILLLLLSIGLARAVRAASTVQMVNYDYSPDPVTIHVGDSITFSNNSGTAHTATSDPGYPFFDTGNVANGTSKTAGPFNSAGDILYHCKYHGSSSLNMKGKIIIQPAASTTATPPTTTPTTTTTPPTTTTKPPKTTKPPTTSSPPSGSTTSSPTATGSGSPEGSASSSSSPSAQVSTTASPNTSPPAQRQPRKGGVAIAGMIAFVAVAAAGGAALWFFRSRS